MMPRGTPGAERAGSYGDASSESGVFNVRPDAALEVSRERRMNRIPVLEAQRRSVALLMESDLSGSRVGLTCLGSSDQ